MGLFAVLSFLLCLPTAYAVSFVFESSAATLSVGEHAVIDLLLDTDGAVINAFEGRVEVPDHLTVRSIRENDSVVTLWAEPPRMDENGVSFAALVPGGYRGQLSPYWKGYRPGSVLSIEVEARHAGSGEITLADDAQVLLHDGEGTPVVYTVTNANVRVVEGVPPAVDAYVDYLSPETFEPEVVSIEGKYYAVFYAIDKHSGVDHYEVAETKDQVQYYDMLPWRVASSPFLLDDQELGSYVYVRAIDRAGNVVTAHVPPRREGEGDGSMEMTITNLLPILLLVLIGLLVGARYRKKIV